MHKMTPFEVTLERVLPYDITPDKKKFFGAYAKPTNKLRRTVVVEAFMGTSVKNVLYTQGNISKHWKIVKVRVYNAKRNRLKVNLVGNY